MNRKIQPTELHKSRASYHIATSFTRPQRFVCRECHNDRVCNRVISKKIYVRFDFTLHPNPTWSRSEKNAEKLTDTTT